LKACIAKQFLAHDVPEKKLVNSFYTHRLDELLTISGLKPELDERLKADTLLDDGWTTILGWSESARYDVGITEMSARQMHAAVSGADSGILPWLKKHW